MLFVSLAGPASNMVLMAMAAVAAKWLLHSGSGLASAHRPERRPTCSSQVVFSFAVVNLLLGLFNLLPIPPLDGSAIFERFLPGRGCRCGTGSAPTGSSWCS